MSKTITRQEYLSAICRCIDVLISKTADKSQQNTARALLKVLLDNIMQYLRGEQAALSTTADAFLKVNELVALFDSLPSDIFAKVFSEKLNIEKEAAIVSVMPALCRVYADVLGNKYKTDEPLQESAKQIKSLKDKFAVVVKILCKDEANIVVSKQLAFIIQLFEVSPLEYIGDDATEELACEIFENQTDCFIHLSKKQTQDVIYRSFNKLRLEGLIDFYKRQGKKGEPKLAKLAETCNFEKPDTIVDDPFYLERAERSKFVKGLQKYTLETLILTRDFLEEKGLNFYLTEGTLLGAVRHNGFIPWDDDVDIAMPRKDYDKLIKLAKKGEVPKELHLDSLETNKKHWVLGAKLQLTRPCEYVQPKVKDLSDYCGPYVDIFPLDYWDTPYGFKNRISDMCVKSARRMLFMKTGFSRALKNKPHRMVMRFLCLFIKNEWIEKFAIKSMKSSYYGKRKYMVNLCSYYPYYKEVFPSGFYGKAVYIDFEGERMPIPSEYDCILKTVYGTRYDTVPPVKYTNLRNHAFELRKTQEES